MQLLQLSITDFGVYQGRVLFDFRTNEKPIIIFGGKNGAGKTTLLEAIKVCLYGNKAFGKKFSRLQYEEYIRKYVHRKRGAVIPLNYMAVSLQFSFTQLGKDHIYEVSRYWKLKSDSVQEQISILVDGKPLAEVPEDYWQDFINDLIPPNIIELFFFDGERIQELVVENFNQQVLATEVKKLLGLSVIERLQTDLDTYLRRQKKENVVSDLMIKLREVEHEYNLKDQEYMAKLREISQSENRIANISGHIERLERKINQESSGYAFQRESIKNQLSSIEIELEIVKKQLHEMSAGLLPFALIPELCSELRSQVINEADFQQWQAAANAVLPKIQEFKNRIRSAEFWSSVDGDLPNESRTVLTNNFLTMLEEMVDQENGPQKLTMIHSLSDTNRTKILTWIDESLRETPNRVQHLGSQLAFLEETRHALLLKLKQVPDDSILKPIIEELNKLSQKLQELKDMLLKQELEKNILNNEREGTIRQVKKAYENLRLGKRVEERLALVKKTQDVLQDFLVEMTRQRIGELEKLLLSRLNELLRKPDLITKIEIDPQSFEIRLTGKGNYNIAKDSLSAGEKQIFAIALLWALRELSGKEFPVIIDTPLGRLDSDHRDRLINTYFPNVSHQVILFSTDTEVDKQYMEALRPNVSRSFYLDYNPESGFTNVFEGYFWNKVS